MQFGSLKNAPPSPHADALQDAIITSRAFIPPDVASPLDLRQVSDLGSPPPAQGGDLATSRGAVAAPGLFFCDGSQKPH